MKTLSVICFFVFCGLACFSQEAKIDSFVNEINNNQIHLIVQYATRIAMKSPAGDSLIKVGKPATEKLMSLLDNPSKGVIAHHILLQIWGSPKGTCDLVSNNQSKEIEGAKGFWLCGLWYYEGEKGNFALNEDLRQNKKMWQSFLKDKSNR